MVSVEMSSNKYLEALRLGIRTRSPKYEAEAAARRSMSHPVSHLPYFHKMATQCASPKRYVKNTFREAEVNEWMRDITVVSVEGADTNKKIGRFSVRRSQLEITRFHSSSFFFDRIDSLFCLKSKRRVIQIISSVPPFNFLLRSGQPAPSFCLFLLSG